MRTDRISAGPRGVVAISQVETSVRRIQSVRLMSENLPAAFLSSERSEML